VRLLRTPPPPMVLLHYNRRCSIPVGAPHSQIALQYFIQCSIQPILSALLLSHGRSSISSSTSNRSASILFQTRYHSPLSALVHWICAPQSPSAVLGLDFRPSISFCAPPSPSALPLPTSHSTSGTAPLLMTHLASPRIRHICLSNPIMIYSSLTSIPSLLDITNRAKRHWNSISPTRQAGIILKYKERLQLPCAVDELCVPVFVGPDEIGDLLDDIETMFDCILIA